MNAREIAYSNLQAWEKTLGPYAPILNTFTRPNWAIGYGAILKMLDKCGPVRTRTSVLIKIGLPHRACVPGYYNCTFNQLSHAGLIAYNRGEGYTITNLGREYLREMAA